MVGVMSIQETTTIYVALLDEGTDVWRPVQAAQRTDGSYIILSTNGDPEDEKWQFPSGSLVQCEPNTLSGGNQLAPGSAAILANSWLSLGSGRSLSFQPGSASSHGCWLVGTRPPTSLCSFTSTPVACRTRL